METLTVEELKKIVEERVKEMGGENILFPDTKEDVLVVIFDSKELTSFRAELPGWTFSGTHLDPTKTRQYKIDFIKGL